MEKIEALHSTLSDALQMLDRLTELSGEMLSALNSITIYSQNVVQKCDIYT